MAKARSPKRRPFELAAQVVEPGSRRQFDVPAAQLYTHTPLDLTVEVIHGRRDGPVLLVCAAIHGDELNGVEIIRRLRTTRALDRLRGTLVMVPVVNLLGFIHRSRYLPDRRDLNRSFPGVAQGSLGARLAWLFFEEIVKKCTHVVDLHTGAIHRENLPQIRAALDDETVREMANGFSIPVIINAGLIDNSLRAEASKLGIPVITFEAGEALRLDEACIVSGVRGVQGVMQKLGMLPARRGRRLTEPFIARTSRWIRSPSDGLFQPLATLGARVEKGDDLGVVSSPFESEESLVAAPFDGIVVGLNRLPLVNEGEALFHVARFGELDAVEEGLQLLGDEIENDSLQPVLSDGAAS